MSLVREMWTQLFCSGSRLRRCRQILGISVETKRGRRVIKYALPVHHLHAAPPDLSSILTSGLIPHQADVWSFCVTSQTWKETCAPPSRGGGEMSGAFSDQTLDEDRRSLPEHLSTCTRLLHLYALRLLHIHQPAEKRMRR